MTRFLIAAAHKSSGKTVVATGLAAALCARGNKVQTFKKGPDYIDPMWLSAASARPCYNLDYNTMAPDELLSFFAARAISDGIALIETNKGLFDGVDLEGSDSNAALAKLLQVPVVLVVDTGGMTRGIAPLLQGYRAFDPDVNIAGVVLNKVGGPRHESKLRAAVEAYTDIPVLGAVGRNPALEIGERHLGLTTPAESGELTDMIETFGAVMARSVDLDRLEQIASQATPLETAATTPMVSTGRPVKIGIARDTAFGFYYADDLEAFADNGAELVPIDTLSDTKLPDIDGLFIGGGFPETQMAGLSANTALMLDIKAKLEGGLPAYAECGGLMYLCESLTWNGTRHEMVGIIPGDAVMHAKPQGRGYARFAETPDHPWGQAGQAVKAHEFHYASVENLPDGLRYGRQIKRGTGIGGQRDAIVLHNLVAGFCHLRSSATNPWVRDFVAFVRRKKR
jgi:cobyrinic acid a,c-diamide synthase